MTKKTNRKENNNKKEKEENVLLKTQDGSSFNYHTHNPYTFNQQKKDNKKDSSLLKQLFCCFT